MQNFIQGFPKVSDFIYHAIYCEIFKPRFKLEFMDNSILITLKTIP